MDSKNTAKNAFLNTLKTVVGIVFPLITYPYITRVLGVNNLGVYNYSYSIVSYFILIASLGISTYGIREGTQYRNDKEAITRFISEVFSINVISTIVSYCLLFMVIFFIPKLSAYRVVISILSLEILFTTLGAAWICNIFEDFLYIAIRTIGMQVVSLGLIFLFVKTEEDLSKYVLILLMANSGANLMNFFYVRKKYVAFRFTFGLNIRKHLKPILIIFSSAVAITIYVSSDMTMLGIMTSDFQVGLYGNAVKIYNIIKNILAAILLVFIPQFSLLFSLNQEDKINQVFTTVTNTLSCIMLPIVVGLFMMSKDIVVLVSGEAFAESSESLKLLSLAVAFSLYSFLYTQCVLIPKKKEKLVFIATSVSAVANILLNLLLIPIWGIKAAAITTIVAEVITFVIAYISGRKYAQTKIVPRDYISVIMGCLLIVVICLLGRFIEAFYLRLAISIGASVVAYFGALAVIKNRTFLNLIHLNSKRQ